MAVVVTDLWHRYAEDWALKSVDVSLDGKGVIGLLGSNGAGKSTLMNILCGCLSQTRGSAVIDGLDTRMKPMAARQRIGFLPQQAPLSFELTIEEYIRFSAGLRKLDGSELEGAVDIVIDRCGLSSMRKRLIGNLSGGYRQRVGIAQALVHRPRLVVLDEPTVGLDPNQIFELRDLIREIGEDHTVLFSTHILKEVEVLCRDVLMLERGEIVFHGEIGAFKSIATPNSIIIKGDSLPLESELKAAHGGIANVEELSAGRLRVFTNGDRGITRALISRVHSEGWRVDELYYEDTSLEDVFKTLSAGAE